jgi:diaminopimelate epimerase
MPGRLEFRKVHGAGNDFVLIQGPLTDVDLPGLARSLCRRRTGIGADGLVISSRLASQQPSYEVRCLNADGSEATMCGNALRCAALCASADHGHRAAALLMAGTWHRSEVRAAEVAVTAEASQITPSAVTLAYEGQSYTFDAISTGTEHAVTFVADVDAIDVEALGRLVRCHQGFAPLGTNVSFVRIASPDALRIRTYERGVEAETLSCGSGAVAAVVIARASGLVGHGPVTVHNRARAPLTVQPVHGQPDSTFWVGGPAAIVFQGALA